MVERITILTEVIDLATGKLREIRSQILRTSDAQRTTTQHYDKMANGQKKLRKTTTQTIKGMHRFRMELLSVMFFGMALNRVFMGMLQPAMEATGIFELLSVTLLSVFMPVALEMLETLLWWSEAFMALDPAAKLFTGRVVAMGAAASAGLMAFGMLGLGIDGMKTAFPILAKLGTKVLGIIPDSVKTKILGAFSSVSTKIKNLNKMSLKDIKWGIIELKDKFVAFAKVKFTALKEGLAGLGTQLKGLTSKVHIIQIAVILASAAVGAWIGQQFAGPALREQLGTYPGASAAEQWGIPGATEFKNIIAQTGFGGNVPYNPYPGREQNLGEIISLLATYGAMAPAVAYAGGLEQSNTFNINAQVSNDVDVRLLGEQIADIQGQQLKGMLVR